MRVGPRNLSTRARLLIIGLLTLFSGCGARESTARLPLPPISADARSLIVIVIAAKGTTLAHAFDLRSGEKQAAVSLSESVLSADVYALVYNTPLATFGLSPGPLALGTGREIFKSDAIFKAHAATQETSPWTPEPEMPPEIASLRLAVSAETLCDAVFSPSGKVMTLPGEPPDGFVQLALPLDDGSALVGMRSGRAYRVTEDAVEPFESLIRASPYLGGGRSADGELWLARGEEIIHGSIREGFTRAGTIPGAPTHYVWMSAETRGGSRVLILLTDAGQLWRLENDSWSLQLETKTWPDTSVATGAAFFIPSRDAVLLLEPNWYPCSDPFTCDLPTNPHNAVLFVDAAHTTNLRAPVATPMAMMLEANGKILVGHHNGKIFERSASGDDAEVWVEAGTVPSHVWSLHETKRGVLVGSERGEISMLRRGLGVCPGPRFKAGQIRHIVPIRASSGRETYVLATDSDPFDRKGGNTVTVMSLP